jgi:hypothetical protein
VWIVDAAIVLLEARKVLAIHAFLVGMNEGYHQTI